MPPNPFTTLRVDIETHWRTYLPRMVAELEAEDRLSEAIQDAVTLTEEAVLEAVSQGQPFWTAWQTYREQWAFLPAEETPPSTLDHFLNEAEEDPEPWLLSLEALADDEADDLNDLFFFDDEDEEDEGVADDPV